MTERYRVGTVTGYPIGQNGHRTSTSPSTVWYVQDSGICYRTVKEFRGLNAETRAHAFADSLNHPAATPRPVRRGVPLPRPIRQVMTYLGYPIVVTHQGVHVHDMRFKAFSGARRHIRDLRRQERNM